MSEPGRPNAVAPAPWDEMVVVGLVARAHGLRGQVIVNPETDFPGARFEPGRTLFRRTDAGAEELRVETLRFHRGRPIIGFEGIGTVEEAERLAGAELRVPAGWLEPLPEGAFYHHDLIGCRVQDTSGETIGLVERIEGDGHASRLVVAAGGEEILVPLAAAICRAIDVGRKEIVIDPPPGLLDLNRARG